MLAGSVYWGIAMIAIARFSALILGLIALTFPLSAQDTGKASGSGEAGELPESAQIVIDKMAQFEEKTMLDAQIKIEQKRGEVIQFLEGRLDVEVRGGNLDGALAIRSEIARLKALPPAQPGAVAGTGKPKSTASAKLADAEKKAAGEKPHPIIGRWKFKDKDGSDLVREFTAAGKCVQFRAGRKEWSLDYAVVNDREVDVVFLGALKFRHSVRGNDTLKITEPDAIAQREEPEE